MSTLYLETWDNLDNWTQCSSGLAQVSNNTLTAVEFNPIYLWNTLIDSNFVTEVYVTAQDDQSLYFFNWDGVVQPEDVNFFNAISYCYFQMIFDVTGSWWYGSVDKLGNVIGTNDIIFAVRKDGYPPEMSGADGSTVKNNFDLYRIGTYVPGNTYRVIFGKSSDGTCYGSVYDVTNGDSLIGSMSALVEIPVENTLAFVLGVGNNYGSYGYIRTVDGLTDTRVSELITLGDVILDPIPPPTILSDNKTVTTTSDEIITQFAKQIEPTSAIGLQRYLDLESITPGHLKNRPEIMELIYMFQDYLNNAYKRIPYHTDTIEYGNINNCGLNDRKTINILREPYDHEITMDIDRENNSMDLENTRHIEEYDANRDISTYIADPIKLNNYIEKYDYEYTIDSPYYNRMKYYYSASELIDRNIVHESAFKVFISTFDNYVQNNSELVNQFVLSSEIVDNIGAFNMDYRINIYFCDYVEFNSLFEYTGEFTLEPTFYPTFDGIIDNYNEYDDINQYSGIYTKATLLNILPTNIGRFRISIASNGLISDIIPDISTTTLPMTIELIFNNMTDFINKMTGSTYPIMAPAFKIIKKWQDPVTFYNEFSSENEYRIDDKKRSVLEKIARIAFNKDPSVIDFEYIQYVASQMGYNIGIEQEDIENNQYYTTRLDKELALRNIIKSLPEYYKIKGTKSGLESILLSFGIVGEIVYLYTTGDNSRAGYADFVDSRLFEGEASDGLIDATLGQEIMSARVRNPAIASSVVDDWFPSPHFKVEIDLLRQDLRLDIQKLGLGLLNKAVKKTKPINTVFQGFYGTLMSNFSYLFIHCPKGHMSAYGRGDVASDCIQTDQWDAKCNTK